MMFRSQLYCMDNSRSNCRGTFRIRTIVAKSRSSISQDARHYDANIGKKNLSITYANKHDNIEISEARQWINNWRQRTHSGISSTVTKASESQNVTAPSSPDTTVKPDDSNTSEIGDEEIISSRRTQLFGVAAGVLSIYLSAKLFSTPEGNGKNKKQSAGKKKQLKTLNQKTLSSSKRNVSKRAINGSQVSDKPSSIKNDSPGILAIIGVLLGLGLGGQVQNRGSGRPKRRRTEGRMKIQAKKKAAMARQLSAKNKLKYNYRLSGNIISDY